MVAGWWGLRHLGVAVVLTGSLILSAPAGAAPVSPVARIRAAPAVIESAGAGHFVSDTWLHRSPPGSGQTQHIAATGDVEFAGTKVSLVNRVTSTTSAGAPLSEQIALGRDYYVRYVSSSTAPGPWSRGRTRQPYPYLGVVEPTALTHYRGPVKVVGTNRVNGAPATEYALTFPAVVRSLPIQGKATQHIRVKPFLVDVWLNRTGQIVRSAAMQIATDNGTTMWSRTVVTLSRFGEPVHIVAPEPLASS